MNKKSVAKKANNSKSKSEEKKLGLDKFGEFIPIPIEDRRKVRAIGRGLQDYWLDCWEADPFGTGWVMLPDDPKNTTLAKYRKQLEELGLFMYEKRGNKGRYTIWCINLRGARAHLAKKTMARYVKNNGWESIPSAAQPWIKSLLKNKLDSETNKLDGIEQKNSLKNKNKLDFETSKLDFETNKLDGIEQKNPESCTEKQIQNPTRCPQDSSKISSKEIFRARSTDLWSDESDRDTAFDGRVTSASPNEEKTEAEGTNPTEVQPDLVNQSNSDSKQTAQSAGKEAPGVLTNKSTQEILNQSYSVDKYSTDTVELSKAQNLAFEAERKTETHQTSFSDGAARIKAKLALDSKKDKIKRFGYEANPMSFSDRQALEEYKRELEF